MVRNLIRVICFGVSCVAGWAVLANLDEFFKGWIPVLGAVISGLAVFALLYFPLGRPIADIVSDRLTVATHRGKHIKSGSGLDEIPDGPMIVPCTICGGKDGPICPKCNEKLQKPQSEEMPF